MSNTSLGKVQFNLVYSVKWDVKKSNSKVQSHDDGFKDRRHDIKVQVSIAAAKHWSQGYFFSVLKYVEFLRNFLLKIFLLFIKYNKHLSDLCVFPSLVTDLNGIVMMRARRGYRG